MFGFAFKWYLERKRDKVIIVREITKNVFKITGGIYIKDNASQFRHNKVNYILGKSSLLSRHSKIIYFFNIKKGETMGCNALKQIGMTKIEFDAYINGGFIASFRNLMKKSMSDWFLIIMAFIAGAGAMSIFGGVS